ncbi:hypothetical protein [uncultured Rubinisphaera sp.]|uniref:zinc ribbon domain-containing protein n=1 Tax=uncultured Rubinisphaera sp. TaxID=1678686 RepID=UPI0030DC7550
MVPNPDSSKVLQRDMPHLRIINDALWYAANNVISDRGKGGSDKTGRDHPLHGIPRDSRGPLSNLFVCGICGSKMYMEGRNEGGYRCSAASKGDCWNKATALRDFVHNQIGTSISNAILHNASLLVPSLASYAEELIRSHGNLGEQESALKKKRLEIEKQKQRLLEYIKTTDQPPEFVQDEMKQLQSDISRLEIETRTFNAKKNRTVESPSVDQLQVLIHEAADKFTLANRETNSLLKTLLQGPIRAIPCQQFGSNKVVLRAELILQLTGLLPSDFRTYLSEESLPESDREITKQSITLDLFQPSFAPKYAVEALRFYESFPQKPPTLTEIKNHLDISRRTAHRALKMGKEMKAAGITDPFIPLTERPENVSRWVSKDSA